MRLEQEVNIFAKDAIKRRFLAAETSVSVTQGKIAALISESEIQELQNSGTTMYRKVGFEHLWTYATILKSCNKIRFCDKSVHSTR